jgi:hypothetical protein
VTIYGIPHAIFWTVGGIAIVIGLISILFPDRIVRCMRIWLIRQLRWLRSPRYRRLLKLQGWLLFVLAVLMLVLMTLFYGGNRPG